MTDLSIRTAGPADVDAVKDLYRRSSLFNVGDRDNLLAHPEVLEWSGDAVGEGRTRIATVAGGRVAGFVTTLVNPSGLELDDLFVDPAWMGRGIGRALVLDAVATARRHDLGRLEVTANPHALAFYRKVGFVADGEVDTRFGPAPRVHLDVT